MVKVDFQGIYIDDIISLECLKRFDPSFKSHLGLSCGDFPIRFGASHSGKTAKKNASGKVSVKL